MKRIVIVGLVVFVGLVVISLSVHRYWIRQYSSTAQVLWHDDECFIFVGVNTVGWSGSYLEEKLGDLKSLLGFFIAPRKLRQDLIVFHYSQGKVSEYHLKGMPSGVGVAPVKGSLYAFIGGQAPLPVWRWDGSSFVRLDSAEAKSVRDSFTFVSELIAREGWVSNDLLSFGVSETVFPAKLESGEIKIILRSRGFPDKQNSISIQRSDRQSPEKLIWEQYDAWKKIDSTSYADFAK